MSSYLYGSYINEFANIGHSKPISEGSDIFSLYTSIINESSTMEELVESLGYVNILNEFDIKEFKNKAIELIKSLVNKFKELIDKAINFIKTGFNKLKAKMLIGKNIFKKLYKVENKEYYDTIKSNAEAAKKLEQITAHANEETDKLINKMKSVQENTLLIKENEEKSTVSSKELYILDIDIEFDDGAFHVFNSFMQMLSVQSLYASTTADFDNDVKDAKKDMDDSDVANRIKEYKVDGFIKINAKEDKVKFPLYSKPIEDIIDNKFPKYAKYYSDIMNKVSKLSSYKSDLIRYQGQIEKFINSDKCKDSTSVNEIIKIMKDAIHLLSLAINKYNNAANVINRHVDNIIHIATGLLNLSHYNKEDNYDYYRDKEKEHEYDEEDED